MGTAGERTTTIGMAEGGSCRAGRLRPRKTSQSASERSEAPLSVANRRDSHTTRVCQATLRPGSVLAGPRRAEEGHGSPTAEGRTRERSPTAPCRKRARSNMSASTGRRLMSPLRPYPARSPAENLQLSRVKLRPINAHRAGRKRSPVWHLGSWNVRSLVTAKDPWKLPDKAWQLRERTDGLTWSSGS